MNCGQQINTSDKSEMNTSSMTKEQMRKYAVETNQPHLFQTTSGSGGDEAKTMTEIMKTNKGQVSIWEWRFAEEYDSRMWYEARCEYLEKKVWEMEAKEAKQEEVETSADEEEDCEECGKCYECGICVCDPSMHIFLYAKGDEDRTLCCECGQDCFEEYKSDGWKRDQDDEEDEEDDE